MKANNSRQQKPIDYEIRIMIRRSPSTMRKKTPRNRPKAFYTSTKLFDENGEPLVERDFEG